MAQSLKKHSNRLIFHTFWLLICKLMRIGIRIKLITLMWIQYLSIRSRSGSGTLVLRTKNKFIVIKFSGPLPRCLTCVLHRILFGVVRNITGTSVYRCFGFEFLFSTAPTAGFFKIQYRGARQGCGSATLLCGSGT